LSGKEIQINESIFEDKCEREIEVEMAMNSRQIQRAGFLYFNFQCYLEDNMNVVISLMLPP
jgi:hypothetical protein